MDKLPTDVTIRNATSQNLDAVIDLLKKADLPVDDVPEVFGECFAVAIEKDSIVGTAAIEQHDTIGLFRSAAVRADQRGKGIGEALTKNRIEWAKAHGISDIYLLTTTAADYFPRLGFEKIPRAKAPPAIAGSAQFTSLCPSSAIVMRLKPGA